MKFKKVYVEITNICNKNCNFCSKTKRKKEEMSIENFKRVIKEIRPYTEYIYLHIKGEPLLHSKFNEILEICALEKVKVNITTNGTFLSKHKKVIESSKAIRQINISLHSCTEKELKDIFETVDVLNKSTKIYFVYRYWTLSTEKLFEKTLCLKKLLEHYKFSTEKIKEIEENMNIKLNNTLYLNKDVEFNWPSLNNNICITDSTCYGLKSHIGILSNGIVVPCCLDSEGVINLGNIFEENLNDILNKEKTQKIINGFKDNKRIEDLCKHCDFKK